MRIAIGKVGKSIKFGPESKASGTKAMTAGSIDARVIFESLIKFNPKDTFYIMGRSNYSRLKPEIRDKINVHENVVDVWAGFKDWWALQEDQDEMTDSWRYIDHVLKEYDHTYDVGIFIAGGVLEYAVQGKTLKEGKHIKTLMAATKYAAPLHHFINETKLPYTMIVTDPRCYPKPCKDLMVSPRRVLSQYNETIDVEHRVSYEEDEMIIDKVPAVYSGVESLYMVEEQWDQGESLDAFFEPEPDPVRDINMTLFLNEGVPSRFPMLKEYILDEVDDVMIYGKWNDKALKDDRIEQVPMAQLSHTFPQIKHTFCIPIKPGWVTGKFWDMVRKGIIPWMHPSYDEQKSLGFPEVLRVHSAKELKEKLDLYNSNDKLYDELQDKLSAMITDDHRSGKFLSDLIMKHTKEILNEH